MPIVAQTNGGLALAAAIGYGRRMVEYGNAVGKGVDGGSAPSGGFDTSFSAAIDQAAAAIDSTIHMVVPAAIPSWLVVGILVLGALYFVFRR